MSQDQYFKDLEEIENLQNSLTRYMMYYKFAMEEIGTKISILQQEFQYIHSYNPIEHVKSRLKNTQSIINKLKRRGYEFSIDSIRQNVLDIAGIRIICSFTSDIYRVAGMLMQQRDIEVIEYKDYIENPKPNGYQSLHMILKIPVFMSDRVEQVYVEVQIRTIAMDFWASLEHKIYYKYDKEVPENLKEDLKDAADQIAHLDHKMEKIHKEMQKLRHENEIKGKAEDKERDRAKTGSKDYEDEKDSSNISMKYFSMMLTNSMET